MLPVKYQFIWPRIFRGEDFSISANQKQESSIWQPYLLRNQNEMRKLYRGPLIDASCQISVHLVDQFQRKRLFLFQPIRNKNRPWPPYLVTDQDEMRKLIMDLTQMLPIKYQFIWPCNSREEDFCYFSQSETRIVQGSCICVWIRTK